MKTEGFWRSREVQALFYAALLVVAYAMPAGYGDGRPGVSVAYDWLRLVFAFLVLMKSADLFVDGAVGIAEIFHLPKMLVGVVLVGFATTAPELAVSTIAAGTGKPEIALGNALGSVVVNNGGAMALAALVATTPVVVEKRLLKSTGILLVSVCVLAYLTALFYGNPPPGADGKFLGNITRPEGIVLVLLLIWYMCHLYRAHTSIVPAHEEAVEHVEQDVSTQGALKKHILLFVLGLAGVLVTAHWVVTSAEGIALHLGVSKAMIGLTVIAVGTSLPEIITCVTAARKGHGEIAAGDILGADILNILWIIGVSAVVHPITVESRVINFAFPSALAFVIVMLICMRHRYRMGKVKGLILLAMYVVYLAATVVLLARPGGGGPVAGTG